MRTSAVGSNCAPTLATSCATLPPKGALAPWGGPAALKASKPAARGFTLLELLVVVAIIALGTAGVSLALRDSGQTGLAREAERLAALFEAARARSRASGQAVHWHATAEGFAFEGLPAGTLPAHWLGAGTRVQGAPRIVLGPEPLIGPQAVLLVGASGPAWRVATDGLRPFAAQPQEQP